MKTDLLLSETSCQLRRPISNLFPLFIFNCCIGYQPGDSVLGLWNVIPEKLRPFSSISVAPDDGIGSGHPRSEEEQYQLLNGWLQIAQQNEIPFFYQISWGPNNLVSPEHVELLYQKYSCFLGVAFTEQCYRLIKSQRCDSIISHLQLAAKYGAYLMFDNNCVEGELGDLGWFSIDCLFKASKKYAANLIVSQKQTQFYGFYAGESMNYGIWLTGHAGNLGVHPDTWSWSETGRGPLFGQQKAARSQDEQKCCVSYPESQLATVIINGILNGATVFTCFENPVYTTQCYGNPTPLFKNVIIPLLEKIVEGFILIPSKEEVIKRSIIAYLPEDNESYHVRDDLFTGLYSMDGNISKNTNWNKTTGRYTTIPILPIKSSYSETSLFQHVLKESQFESNFCNSLDLKIQYFNQFFSPEYSGDLFVQRVEHLWYTYNSCLNEDVQQCAQITLNQFGTNLKLQYSPNTYGIINDSKNTLKFHLGNYLTDKSEVWSDEKQWTPTSVTLGRAWEQNLNDWIQNRYIPFPQDQQKRETVITLSPLYVKPVLTLVDIGDHPKTDFLEEWVGNTYLLHVWHNGAFDLLLSIE